MTNSAYDGLHEEGFFDRVQAKFLEKAPNLSKTLNIAVIGKVSFGKSSFLFLYAKSFLPPTGIVDLAAAIVAVSITLALLATVNHVLFIGFELEEEELLQSTFKRNHKRAKDLMKELALTDIKDIPKDISGWSTIVTRFVFS